MDNIKISLAIFGNQNSNSGFQPLYWINDPPQQLENIVPPGMDENPYFFTLQVLPAHTQYTLIHNRVSSYMSVRPGVLKMAITIPKGYCISDGISPMQVLLDIRQKFIDTCMTLRDTQSKAYNFKEKLVSPDVFINIINTYRLMPDTQPHLPMTGTEDAVMLLDDTAISLFFIAPQRPELQKFRRIIIANKGKTDIYKNPFDNIAAATVSEVRDVYTDNPTVSSKSENITTISPNKPAQQKKRLLILLCLLVIIGGVIILLWPTSDHKKEKKETEDMIMSDQEDDIDEEMEITDEEEEMSSPFEEKKIIKDSKQPIIHDKTQQHSDEAAQTHKGINIGI